MARRDPGARRIRGLTLGILLLIPVFVRAQGLSADASATPRLPFSIERIMNRLQAAEPRAQPEGLRLDFYLEVAAKATPLDLIGEFDLGSSAVQYGPPTHAEALAVMTPRELQTPAADLIEPMRALIGWIKMKRAGGMAPRPRTGRLRTQPPQPTSR